MGVIEFIAGLVLVLSTLWDAFETIVLPRTIRRVLRLTRMVYLASWFAWSSIVRPRASFQEPLLGFFGPLFLIFLALVISYLPIFYQAFSRREVHISMMDARAGSPPTAGEMLRRNGEQGTRDFLAKSEVWASDLLESHLSYPALAHFRSQHENQSWLAALTMVLDTCALIMTGLDGLPSDQARFTFAIARHALVDLSQIFASAPVTLPDDRLSR